MSLAQISDAPAAPGPLARVAVLARTAAARLVPLVPEGLRSRAARLWNGAAEGTPQPLAGSGEQLVRGAIAGCRKGIILVGIFSVIVNILMLTTSVYLMQLSDRVLVSRSLDTLVLLTVGAVIALITLSLFDLLRKWILTRLGVKLETMLGGPLLAASIERTQPGVAPEVQGLRDLGQVRGFLAGPVVPLLFDLPIAPFYIFVVFAIHWDLGLITTLGSAVLMTLAYFNQSLTKKAFASSSRHAMVALARAQAHTRNADAVRAMGMLPDCVRLWGAENVLSIESQNVAGARNAVLAAISKFFRLILQVAVLGWGAYLSLNGELTSGMAIAASIIGARALQPIEGSIESWKTFVQAQEAFLRLKSLLLASSITQKRTLLPEPKGEIFVDKLVYLAPQSREPIIKQISFGIHPGVLTALIGSTGAGKSTLGKMLVGASVPASGSVRLDGSDLRNWDPQQLGRHVGYLPQDVELFPGTIAENIARMRADVSSEEIVAAAKFAHAHDLIVRMKNGYETMIYERGAPLSGGQRQRVALARAFFGNPKFVMLDEPDAALDREGEEALLKTLMNAKRAGITVVVTTQRPQLLRFVDRILVMKDGAVDIYGPREKVMARLTGAPAGTPDKSTEPQPGAVPSTLAEISAAVEPLSTVAAQQAS